MGRYRCCPGAGHFLNSVVSKLFGCSDCVAPFGQLGTHLLFYLHPPCLSPSLPSSPSPPLPPLPPSPPLPPLPSLPSLPPLPSLPSPPSPPSLPSLSVSPHPPSYLSVLTSSQSANSARCHLVATVYLISYKHRWSIALTGVYCLHTTCTNHLMLRHAVNTCSWDDYFSPLPPSPPSLSSSLLPPSPPSLSLPPSSLPPLPPSLFLPPPSLPSLSLSSSLLPPSSLLKPPNSCIW